MQAQQDSLLRNGNVSAAVSASSLTKSWKLRSMRDLQLIQLCRRWPGQDAWGKKILSKFCQSETLFTSTTRDSWSRRSPRTTWVITPRECHYWVDIVLSGLGAESGQCEQLRQWRLSVSGHQPSPLLHINQPLCSRWDIWYFSSTQH